MGRALNIASQGAANTAPQHAPEHLQMVNNLINDANTNTHHENTNLTDTIDWGKLGTHMENINNYPRCVCFNVSTMCGRVCGACGACRCGASCADVTLTPRFHACQCGMMMYPQQAKKITCSHITRREDCRAYRVFEDYINPLVRYLTLFSGGGNSGSGRA